MAKTSATELWRPGSLFADTEKGALSSPDTKKRPRPPGAPHQFITRNRGEPAILKPGRSEITCRAVGPIKTPDGEPFEEFIRRAFIADMSIAEVYSTAAPVTLTGRLDAIDFSSGMTDAAWDIAMTLSSSNGKSLSTDNHYSFSGNFVGEVACNQTAQALMPAVQDLIGKIIAHPDFADLLR